MKEYQISHVRADFNLRGYESQLTTWLDPADDSVILCDHIMEYLAQNPNSSNRKPGKGGLVTSSWSDFNREDSDSGPGTITRKLVKKRFTKSDY